MEVEIIELGGGPLAARVARFPDFSITHARLPQSKQLWHRGRTGRRATLLIQLEGRTEIEGPEGGTVRAPGVHLVGAGEGATVLRTTAPRNEVVCVRLCPDRFADQLPSSGAPSTRIMDVGELGPMLAFITNTCAVRDLSDDAARAIAPAAEQVVRSLLVAALGERVHTEPLFVRARGYILRNFTDPGLRIEQVAQHLGVSVRTVQAELKEGDTSFSRLLLDARAQAAHGLLAEHPGIARADLARRSGFGSVSSLQRALRTA